MNIDKAMETARLLATIEEDSNSVANMFRILVAKIERLQAIVDQYQKTADGVPATPNMQLFFKHPELDEIWAWRVGITYNTKCFSSTFDSDDSWRIKVSDCYSTREAVNAAQTDR